MPINSKYDVFEREIESGVPVQVIEPFYFEQDTPAIKLLKSNRETLSTYDHFLGPLLDFVGVPGFAGDIITADVLIDPNDWGKITPQNAYALADKRFRDLNRKSGGDLRADDFASIRDAYFRIANVDVTDIETEMDKAGNKGPGAVEVFQEEYKAGFRAQSAAVGEVLGNSAATFTEEFLTKGWPFVLLAAGGVILWRTFK